jgi:glycosyltransferase involved in cell wall biosynthesis
MKIVLLVTSPDGAMCGVADYTTRLGEAFGSTGADCQIEQVKGWTFGEVMRLRRTYSGQKPVIFHLQYPSIGMGHSLMPGFLPLLLGKTCVTLHEFGLFSLPRKLMFLPHALFSKAIVFSNEAERDRFKRWFPFSASRLHVLPIGNNILRLNAPEIARKPGRLIYFGQISRDKGIEFFVETAEKLRQSGSKQEIALMGSIVSNDPEFTDPVYQACEELGIDMRFNLRAEDVSRELSQADIALLPFPDGVSNKRGSALACLDHGVAVVTKQSALTPQWLKDTTHGVTSSQEAADVVAAITAGTRERQPKPALLAQEMGNRDWVQIARNHLAIYG